MGISGTETELQILLHLSVFVAAALQTVIGIGFGLIAGPTLLLVLQDASAIQITIILSLLIVTVLARSILKQCDRVLLRSFIIGSIPGILLGAIAYYSFSISVLKQLAGVTVLLMLVLTSDFVRSRFGSTLRDSSGARLLAGTWSGLLTALLAMPGPPLAAFMLFTGQEMARTRTTILAMFLFAFTAALLAQSITSSIEIGAVRTSAVLAPATLLGVYCGLRLLRFVPQRLFLHLVKIILFLSGVTLFL